MSDFMSRVTHGIKRGRFEISRRTILYVSVFVVGATLVATLYLMLVSWTAASGRHIEQLRTDLLWLRRENEQIEVKIAQEGSIPRLWERATELGFGSAEKVEFLSVPVSY